MANGFGSFGAGIPSGAEAIQAAIQRRGGLQSPSTQPVLSQSPLSSPRAQGVPPQPSALPSPGAPQAAAPRPPEEESMVIIKALAQRLRQIGQADQQRQAFG
jgi:hypothetical protein